MIDPFSTSNTKVAAALYCLAPLTFLHSTWDPSDKGRCIFSFEGDPKIHEWASQHPNIWVPNGPYNEALKWAGKTARETYEHYLANH